MRTIRATNGTGWLRWMVLAVMVVLSGPVSSAPGDILFQDNFNRANPATAALTDGVGNGWVVAMPTTTPLGVAVTTNCVGAAGRQGCAGIDTDSLPWSTTTLPLAIRARGAGSQTLYLRWSAVTVDHALNLAGKPGANVSFWLRRGSDCFSEMPGDPQSDPGCMPAAQATITVTGNKANTTLSGITVNGVQIMSAAYSGNNVSASAVATAVAALINLNGYAASAANGVITIRGPAQANGNTPLIGTATGKTFTSASFAAPTQAAFTPMYGEEFLVQYLSSANTWVTLAQFPNDGTAGEEFTPSIDLPADALWSGFKLRFYQPNGSGGNTTLGSGATGVYGRDYWHVDDVKITELAATSFSGSFCDTFEGDLSRWVMTGTGTAAIGSKYFQNGAHSLDVKWGAVTVTSKPSDMTGVTGPIVYWVKRGVGNVTQAPNTTGSDLPEAGENLVVEYLKANGTWGALVPATTFVGGGTGGQVWSATTTPATNSITIPADANLTAFQMRFRLIAGTGYDMDYWHIDDVCVGDAIQNADIELVSVTPASNNLAPGASTSMTITIRNNGAAGIPANGSITVTDTLAQGLIFDSVDLVATPGWSCTSTTTTVTCTRTGALAAGASTALKLNVHADPVASGTFTNSVTVGSQSINDTSLANNTKTNSYTFIPALFDAYETTMPAGAVAGSIYTKLANQSFNLKVVAVNGGAINSAYNKTVTVSLIDGAAACVSATPALAGVTVNPASHAYVAGDAGVYTFTFTSTVAYGNVQVRMVDTAGTVGCSSDVFAIRPQSFTVSSSNANADGTGTSATNLPKLLSAATSFILTADSATAGYGGTPSVDLTKVQAHGGAVQSGVLSGSFTGAANVATGNGATGTGFTYDEVGYFRFDVGGVYDNTFTAVDSAMNHCVAGSSSNIADAAGRFGCDIGNVVSPYFGRFIPDHFSTTVSGPLGCDANAGCVSPVATMAYSGQPFSAMTVMALNAVNAVTKNYQGAFAKSVALSAVDAKGGATLSGSVGSLGYTLGSFTNGSAPSSNSNFSFAAVPTVPTNVFVRATESGGDGVTSLLAAATSSDEGGVRVVSGRVKIINAYGSELLPLTLTATVQYFSALGWVQSMTDGITGLILSPTYTVGGGTTSATPTSGTVSGGKLDIVLSKPTAGAGEATITPVQPGYLAAGTGRATFGVYNSNSRYIFRHESY